MMPSPSNPSNQTAQTPTQDSKPKTNKNAAGLGRQLPHAADAERALLGSMLLEDSAISEAITCLADGAASAFWLERHQKLYDLMVSLWNANKPIDGVVIKDELLRVGTFDELGGYDFLGTLVGSVPSAARVREYAQIVRDKALLRKLIAATHRVMDAAYQDDQAAQEVLDYAEKEVFDVTEQRVTGGARLLPELLEEAFRQIEQRGRDGNVLTGEPSGFTELDELTCGLQPGELIIVAARPSMGKTAIGLNMAEHMALSETEPRPVLFFSLEMSRQQVAQRILCSRAGVDAHRLRRGRHSDQEMLALQRAAAEANEKPLLVDDSASLTILELRARSRIAYRKHKLRAIFVDYLQLMHAPRSESRQQEVASISRGLKALAKELNLPVIAMAQLNRNVEDRSSNRPRMSDLRESGAIEQDADVVLLLHRESYYKTAQRGADAEDDNKAELIIAKQRNGPVGTLDLHFDRRYTRFSSYDPGRRYEDIPEAQYAADVDFH